MAHIFKKILGVISIIAGFLIILQGSDLNPLLQIDNYREWFNLNIFLNSTPALLFWIIGCLIIGGTVASIGLLLLGLREHHLKK